MTSFSILFCPAEGRSRGDGAGRPAVERLEGGATGTDRRGCTHTVRRTTSARLNCRAGSGAKAGDAIIGLKASGAAFQKRLNRAIGWSFIAAAACEPPGDGLQDIRSPPGNLYHQYGVAEHAFCILLGRSRRSPPRAWHSRVCPLTNIMLLTASVYQNYTTHAN